MKPAEPTTQAGRALLDALPGPTTRAGMALRILAIEAEAREQGRREERAAWLLGEKRRVEVE